MKSRGSDSKEAASSDAARWYAKRDRGLTEAEEAELRDWLAEPGHAEAFRQAGAAWEVLAPLQVFGGSANRIDPDLLVGDRRDDGSRRGFRLLFPIALAAAAALAVALTGFLWLRAHSAQPSLRYGAADSASRYVLPDGSVAELNRGAEIEMRNGPAERSVDLLKGEAHFTVARDPERPFVVRAGGAAIKDLGTAFDVRIASDEVVVLVTQGRVEVSRPAGSHSAALVVAGQRAAVRPGAIEIEDASPIEAQNLLAWEGRRLVFVNTPLAEAVAQMNRFNRRKMIVEDPETASLLIGGSFQVDNVDGFLRLMQDGFGVASQPRGENEWVLRKAK